MSTEYRSNFVALCRNYDVSIWVKILEWSPLKSQTKKLAITFLYTLKVNPLVLLCPYNIACNRFSTFKIWSNQTSQSVTTKIYTDIFSEFTAFEQQRLCFWRTTTICYLSICWINMFISFKPWYGICCSHYQPEYMCIKHKLYICLQKYFSSRRNIFSYNLSETCLYIEVPNKGKGEAINDSRISQNVYIIMVGFLFPIEFENSLILLP